jgi:hypothetical protein
MLRFLRRSRLVPILLLLATPGVGGALVQAGHPCADAAPWTAVAQEAGGHQHHGPAGGAPGDPGPSGHPCECIGACQGSAAPVGPAGPPLLVVAALRIEAPARFASRAEAPYARPDRLLPPAHAPPLS